MALVSEILERNREVIRQSLREIEAQKIEIQNDNISDALDYLERNGDLEKVRERLKIRGAIGIKKSRNDAGYETYTKQRTAEKVDSGEYEVITPNIGGKICRARANLFNNRTQSFSYFTDQVDENDNLIPDEDAASNVESLRSIGGFESALVEGDWIACGVDSGPVLVQWVGDMPKYNAFSPSNLYFKFHDSIIDNGSSRGVYYDEIEDCTAMVIRLSSLSSTIDQQSYLAVMGRSSDPRYPLGRHVYYTARNWWDIPEPGEENATDWKYNGQIANPLSVYAAQSNSTKTIEYPIIILKGGLSKTRNDTPAPTSDTLYQVSLELDVAFSRLLKDSLSMALGIKAVKNTGGTTTIPRCLEGAVLLHEGQELEIHSVPSSNVTSALEIVKAEARGFAEGYSVPGYQVLSTDTQVEPGVALYIRTKPLEQEWEHRAKSNKSQMRRLFEIERGLYKIYTGQELTAPTTQQVWNPGRFIYPESMTEKEARLKKTMDDKGISYVRYIRDLHDLATDRQAIEFIKMMELQNAENPPPSSPQQNGGVTPGLASRFARQ